MLSQRNATGGPSNRLPTKWAVAVVALLIGYALLQPQLNKRLGWRLPSLSSLDQDEPTARQKPSQSDVKNKQGASPQGDVQLPKRPSSKARPTKPESSKSQADEVSLFGLLRKIAPDEYISPEGMRYTRGSAEGHRLKHLERHLSDDPDRPGKHGVFDGDMPQVLRWLDEAYARGSSGAKGSKKISEGDRTVYEVAFPKAVGYIGGRDGGRAKHPDARHIRLVVQGDRFITAFPF